VRPLIEVQHPAPPKISIHAPVKGATHGDVGPWDQLIISIHAPVKGATYNVFKLFTIDIISIHAPVKGATVGG